MDHLERFYSTIERKPVDRPASWLGKPDPESYIDRDLYKKVVNDVPKGLAVPGVLL